MTLPSYPEYKESGFEVIGEVPSEWRVLQLKRFARLSYGDALPTDQRHEDGPVLVYGSNGAVGHHSVPNTSAPAVLVGRKGSYGALNWSEDAAFAIDTVYFIDRTTTQADLRWVFWLLHIAEFSAYSQDTGVPGLSREVAYETWLPAPSIVDEQSAIAAFLDRETGKIGALVAEQEKLIELLKEKRQAVISHAVTKGLDPDVPMQESGIDWLGLVPEHWKTCRLKHACSDVVDCLHTTPTYDGELEFPAIRTADIERGVLLLERARLVSRQVYEERIQRLRPVDGDILYSREGERFGMAALVPENVDLCLGQRMMMFRTRDGFHSGYVMWLLNSDSVYQQVLEKVGGATSPHVNISDIVNFHIPCPPRDEQERIADHVSEVTASLDALVSEAQRAIALLKERRSGLISAAVTGKIDVRGLVVAETTEAA